MVMNEKKLVAIFDAPLEELLEKAIESECDSNEALYIQILIAYLQGENQHLKALLEKSANCGNTVLHKVGQLRLQIRESSIDSLLMGELKELAEHSPVWKGEINFVLGYAKTKLQKWEKSKAFFKKACASLEKNGAKRKASLAFQNVVNCDSYIHPHKKMIAELHYLAKKAHKARAYSVAGLAYLNLSREYQLINAVQSALKYCYMAEEYMEKNAGTLQYYFCKAQRCHLYIESDRIQEAEALYDELKLCQLQEIKNALLVLENLLRDTPIPEQLKLSPTWQDRVDRKGAGKDKVKLGKLEEKFLEYICQEPREKFDIIEQLYGNLLDYEVTDNRLKGLISRLRKKVPNLIIFKDGHYTISDKLLLKEYKSVS